MAARVNPFPYPVQSLTDLPQQYQQAVQRALSPGEPVNSILMIPPQPFLKRGGIPQQVIISTSRGLLHLQETAAPDQPPIATYLPGDALLYAHHSLILLYGRLELVGEVDGSLVRMVVEYNMVGQHLLQPILRQFLQFTLEQHRATKPGWVSTAHLLEELGAQSFKFRSGLELYALQPGEQLLGYVFQQRLTRRKLRLFEIPVLGAALLALTDRAVILIKENQIKGAAYGWLITICPRVFVTGIESSPNEEWREVHIRLARNNVTMEHHVTLENNLALAWQDLWPGQSKSALG